MATEIMFAPEADRFSLVSQQTVDVWTMSQAGVEKRINCNSKPSTVQWLTNDKILIGLDNGNILLMNVSNSEAVTFSAHKQRVKCICYDNEILHTASSTGEIKSWTLSDSNNLTEVSSISAGCRITCMILHKQNHLVKNEEQSDVEDNAEEKNENDNGDDNNEKLPQTLKTKSTFVTVSYEDDSEPPKKKLKPKKKKNNKKIKKL